MKQRHETFEFEELLLKKAMLDKEIEEARARSFQAVIERIKDLMVKYGIKVDDIRPEGASASPIRRRRKAQPKYQNPETGETWTGRGVAPRWISGQDKSQFEIQREGRRAAR